MNIKHNTITAFRPIFFSFSSGKVDETHAGWGFTVSTMGFSPCPPWASFCPWHQLSWHVCARSLCYLFLRVRYLICAPRAHALPRSAALQAGATKGSWGLPALVAVSVYQRPEPCLSKEMSSKCFPFSLLGEVRVCFWPIFVFLSDTIQ